ncbi:HAD family hydrolase [Megalodesulfovibrio gigas]|uniref:HAD family hydrolase n=1 Tax=Megalodesulfovibrio gigas TaxID=879 RepID=UPI0003FB6D38|nr:HAD hydrolase-like protein [Megalodesulfovibrio gigas]
MDAPPPAAALQSLPCAVVFDFDGTLAELVLDFDEMKRRVAWIAAEFLLPAPVPGPTPVLEWIDAMRAEIDGRCGHDAGVHFFFQAHAAVTAMELEAALVGRLFEGARPLLVRLRQAGTRVGVITRNCDAAVRQVFPDLDACCDAFLPRNSVRHVKPHPQHLLQALELLRCPPGDALMVGDHPMDVTTALRAGTRAAGVASGRVSMQTLAEAGAHLVAPDAPALFAHLFQT